MDSLITDEKWILKPCQFIKIGKINPINLPKELFMTPTGTLEDLKKQKILYKKLKKINIKNVIE